MREACPALAHRHAARRELEVELELLVVVLAEQLLPALVVVRVEAVEVQLLLLLEPDCGAEGVSESDAAELRGGIARQVGVARTRLRDPRLGVDRHELVEDVGALGRVQLLHERERRARRRVRREERRPAGGGRGRRGRRRRAAEDVESDDGGVQRGGEERYPHGYVDVRRLQREQRRRALAERGRDLSGFGAHGRTSRR